MKIKNKKGFGLVMAIMTITILLIMAAGFFHVTNYSSQHVAKNIRDMRLYWAAESASNYNVNWWVEQEEAIRINWPSEYIPPEEAKSSRATKAPISDQNSYKFKEETLHDGDITTSDGYYYLHASSVYELNNNPQINGFEIVTVRYKGSRKDKPDEAVWILDSYARDIETGNFTNITLTNVWNTVYDASTGWLANSEAIVLTVAGGGFNGALGAFHEKDIRYGDCYYADLIRLDAQTGGSEGARFYKGPIKSSALHEVGALNAQSRWGATLSTTTDLFDVGHYYGYGLALRENHPDEGAAASRITEHFTSQIDPTVITPYIKNADPLPTEGALWTWRQIADEGSTIGILMLDSINGSGNVTITLETTENGTDCNIDADGTVTTKKLGTGGINGIAVPSNYGEVDISGVSNQNFTLVTETDQVNIVDDFYIEAAQKSMDLLRETYDNNPLDLEQTSTKEEILAQLWENMSTKTSKTQLSIISQRNSKKTPEGDPFYLYPNRRDLLLFTTASYAAWNGLISMPPNYSNSPDLKFFNVGSAITFNRQGTFGGDPSGAWTKALIQDRRYIQDTEDGGLHDPIGWGSPPDSDDPFTPLYGLNAEHRWSKSSTGKTKDINNVAWPTGTVPYF